MSQTTTGEVTSKDGTRIVFERTGEGPPVILVGGALSDRRAAAPFAAELSPDFTTYAYDRRGKGDSGDTQPYAVEREVEDLDALIRDAGGRAFLFGVSSGAALALETAAWSGGADKLAVYEPPYDLDESEPRIPDDFVARLDGFRAEDRRGDAVEYFMTAGVGLSQEEVAQMRGAVLARPGGGGPHPPVRGQGDGVRRARPLAAGRALEGDRGPGARDGRGGEPGLDAERRSRRGRGAPRRHLSLAPGADPPGRTGGRGARPARVLPRLRPRVADDLNAVARAIVDDNRYMVLGTADASGKPWATPCTTPPTATATSTGSRRSTGRIRATSPLGPRSPS